MRRSSGPLRRPSSRQAWPVVERNEYVHGMHIDSVCDHLQAVSEGYIHRLIINQPPRTMKSLTSCVFWPMWEWLRSPSTRWMFLSYAQNLAIRDSLRCRRLLTSPGGKAE